jgi:hypothetical protein
MGVPVEIGRQAASGLAAEYDKRLIAAIKVKCPEFDILCFDMSRFQRLVTPDGSETVTLDGEPIFMVSPIEFSEDLVVGAHKFHATRKYWSIAQDTHQ